MDLRDFFKVVWRHKWMMIFSIFVGLFLSATVAQRSYTTYESRIELLIDEQGFGLGRIDSNLGQMAAMANTYVSIIMSDQVLDKVGKDFELKTVEITAQAAQNAPIIVVSTTGESRSMTQGVAQAVAESFLRYFKDLQKKNKIPRKARVSITLLGEASPPVPLKSRKMEIMLIMFFAPIMAAAGFSFILKNFSDSKPPKAATHVNKNIEVPSLIPEGGKRRSTTERK